MLLDLWLNAVFNDTDVVGSEICPMVYFRNGSRLPLLSYADMAQRWSVSKSAVHRFLKKFEELEMLVTFSFPGTVGSVVCLSNYLSTMFCVADPHPDKSFARSLERSRKMLDLLDAAILLMRKHHKKGELYYWILYYTFLSPQEYANYREILTALEAHFPPMSRRTYYIRREEAVQTLSSVLWGYTSKECLSVLEQLEL